MDIRVAAGTCQAITASSFAAIMEASSATEKGSVAFDRAYPSTAKDSLATTSSFIEEVTVASSVASPSLVATCPSLEACRPSLAVAFLPSLVAYHPSLVVACLPSS